MKNSLVVFCLALCFAFCVKAQQTVVWGAQVVDVSSEFSPLEYSAIQTLHKPNVLPRGGDNPNAWRPKSENREEFVMVSFDKPIRAKQVAIAESENPGAVNKVYAYDSEYNEYTLFELTPRPIPLESRLLNLFFEETPYEIYAIKVFIDGEAVPGYNAVDAIGISSSNIPINVLIKLAPGMSQTGEAEKLGVNVNSQYIEHSPIISPDGKRLYFSRRYHPDNVGGEDDVEDIWVSDLDEATGEWLPARNVGPPLNTAGPNFISSVTMVNNEEVLILGNRYGKKGRMYSGVSISKRKGDSFEYPESVEIENDYNYSPKVDYNLAANGEVMILSLERDDSFGHRDLYVSFLNGKLWSEPKTLGLVVNTASDDYAPFLGVDGRTLYYSTTGLSGYGGSDIFVSFRLDNSWQKWSEPENLGTSINTETDDEYFSIPNTGQNIYFARGNGDDDTDIFRFNADQLIVDPNSELMASLSNIIPETPREHFVTIYGQVLDEESDQPIEGAEVIIERLPDGIDIGHLVPNANGGYSVMVRGGARYGIMAKRDGYLSTNENFDFNEIDNSDSLNVNLYLHQIRTGATFVLKNIFFEFDKSDLKTSSYPELTRVLKYLEEGLITKIEISGHTDSAGDAEYNQKLSQKRANAVMEFFANNGISAEHLVAKGYGESAPKVPNDTKENRAINRRVEFKIVE